MHMCHPIRFTLQRNNFGCARRQTLVGGVLYKSYRRNTLKKLSLHNLVHYSGAICEQALKHSSKYVCSVTSVTDKMVVNLLSPPVNVRGMTELNRDAFKTKVLIPHITVPADKINSAVSLLKKYLLKMCKLRPVADDTNDSNKKIILLNPILVNSVEDIREVFEELGDDISYIRKEVNLNYENWKADEILKAVLPINQDGAAGYSVIGHILHLNLKEHLLPYKTIIGKVLLDKTPNVSLVVNKTDTIDTTFRTFQMEILAGSGNTFATVKENGCTFTFDFAKVYWNPRLATEHQRIVTKFKHGDVLYDVMAGVGPFSVPAGRKKCQVLANDLNPYSYHFLVKNCTQNKVNEKVKCYCVDGQEFIKTALKDDLAEKWADTYFCGSIHITMNLPASAVQFLSAFIGLYENVQNIPQNPTLPVVHVYMFTKDSDEDTAISLVAENLGYPIDSSCDSDCSQVEKLEGDCSQAEKYEADQNISKSTGSFTTSETQNTFGGLRQYVEEVVMVRRVAPNKVMMRVSVRLPLKVLVNNHSEDLEPPSKKLKES